MYTFNYRRPASLDEAKHILAANTDAKLLAGGMTLLPTMKLRLAQPSDLVDLSGIDQTADKTASVIFTTASDGEEMTADFAADAPFEVPALTGIVFSLN